MDFRGKKQARRGLTLIELVIVLVILAATAALVIPRLGFLKSQSDAATSAASSADLVTHIEAYKASAGSYPLRLDSLMAGNGGSAPTTLYSRLFFHSPATAPDKFEVLDLNTLGSGWRGSWAHSGITTVVDHDETATNYSNSGTVSRTLSTATNRTLAFVKTTDTTINAALGYPNGLPVDSGGAPTIRFVALGVGPQNGAIGKTMISAPRHSGASDTSYGRYILLFGVYASGKGADLRGAINSQYTTIEGSITSYKSAAPAHE